MSKDFVRAVRMYHNWSQKEFAEKLGVSVATIGMVEAGYREVSDRLKSKVVANITLDDSFYIYYENYNRLSQ